jgi:hypothetical protein
MSTAKPNTTEFGQPLHAVSPSTETNLRISAILNEARHVFDCHAEGIWKTDYKEGFARLLMPDLHAHPKLIKQINELNDRVFSMVTYRAVELLNESHPSSARPPA